MKLNTVGTATFDLDVNGSLRRASEGKTRRQGEESAQAAEWLGGLERTQGTGELVTALSEQQAGSQVRLPAAAKGT